MKRIIALAAAAGLLAGCTGGSGVIPQASECADCGPAVATGTAKVKRARAEFRIKWPKRKTRVEGRRGAFWISPAAASVVVQIDDESKLVTFANAPKGGGISTIQFAAPVGSDQIAFMLYDRAQKAGTPVPAGNLVGQAVVQATIKAGVLNTVKATVAGVAQTLAIAAVPHQPLLKADAKTGGFDIVGDSPQSFVAVAEDADGNAIVPQPQQFTVAASALSYGYLTVGVPDPKNQPQLFTASIAHPPSPGQSLAVQASATDSLGNHVQADVNLTAIAAIYASYASSPSKGQRIVLFAGTGKRVALGATAFAGIGKISAFTYDPIDHHVIVADVNNNVIEAYNADGSPATDFTPIPAQGVISMTFDTNDHELYADNANGVFAFTAQGSPISLGFPAFSNTRPLGPIGYFPQQPFIIVGQGAVSGSASGSGSGSVGDFDAYNESGTYNETTTPGVTRAIAIASDPLGGFDYLALGTPATASGPNFFALFPFNAIDNSATLVDPRALAVDTISGDVFVASGSGNKIEPVVYNSPSVAFGTIDTHVPTLVTPAGYKTPTGIATAF